MDENLTIFFTYMSSYATAIDINVNVVDSSHQPVHVLDLTGGTACQVCAAFKPGVIDICGKGHIICVNCIREVTSCPICRRKFTTNEDVSLYGTPKAAKAARARAGLREQEVFNDYSNTLWPAIGYLG